jgi:lipoprotein-releasing system ATP-binding protein
MSNLALRISNLQRSFITGDKKLVVLDGAALEIQPGAIVGLIGPSGSGKSSLLHAAGLLERPNGGEITIGETRSAWSLDDNGRTRVRRENIGFVYQFHHLLPEFDAVENVAVPALIAGRAKKEAHAAARAQLERLGLGERLHHRPAQLSGGEQQRVAIARALINKPVLILADEPTGNLDPETSTIVFGELLHAVREEGAAALIATHNYELTKFMDRVVALEHGKLVQKS